MKTIDEALQTLREALSRETLDDYIRRRWVKPLCIEETFYLEEIDVARIQLIQQLRHDMQVGDEAMDVVLMLLDQMYGLRARLRLLTGAIERQPRRVQADIFSLLAEIGEEG